MTESLTINQELNQRIEDCLLSLIAKPVSNLPPVNPAFYDAPAHIVAVPQVINHNPVIIDNSVRNINNFHETPQGQLRQRRKEKDEEKQDLSAAQVIGAATVFTSAAIGIAYFWNERHDLKELTVLRDDCLTEIGRLNALQNVTPNLAKHKTQQLQILNNAISILEQVFDYQSTKHNCSIGTVASVGMTIAGAILVPNFVNGWYGIAGVASTCICIFGLAQNYFSFSKNKPDINATLELIRQMKIFTSDMVQSLYPELHGLVE